MIIFRYKQTDRHFIIIYISSLSPSSSSLQIWSSDKPTVHRRWEENLHHQLPRKVKTATPPTIIRQWTIIIFNLQKMNSLGTCHKVWNRSCLIPYKQGSLRPHAGAGLWYWRTQENWNIENIKSRKTIKERNQNWVN